MWKHSLKAVVLMLASFAFLSLRTPVFKPVNPSSAYKGIAERALPVLSHGSHGNETVNEEHIFKIMPKDSQEDPDVASYETKQEGGEYKYVSSQSELQGDLQADKISNNNGRSQSTQTAPRDREETPFLNVPAREWAHLHKAIRLWNRNGTWGSHPLPGASQFKAGPGSRWVTFFHDQAVVPMLVADNSTILDCMVQEVIEKWEQAKSLKYLGNIMPLEPVELPFMVHLSSLCGIMNTPPPAAQLPSESFNIWTHGLSMLQGILPGTLWCGRSDKARVYGQLGTRAALDSCCRTHDHCPTKLLPMDTRYGLSNLSLKTMSHCSCELEFYRCLKAAQADPLAVTVGQVYFNFLKLDCLSPVPASTSKSERNTPGPSPSTHVASRTGPKFVCYREDSNGGCRKWVANPQVQPAVYKFTPSTLTF